MVKQIKMEGETKMIRENDRDYTKQTRPKKITEPPKIKKGKVFNCTRLNIREEPDKSSNVKHVVCVDTELEYEDFNENWCKVWFDGKEGFAMKSYIKET